VNTLKTVCLSFINILFKKLTIEKIYAYLYTRHHNIFVRIESKRYSFWYRSVDFDDLNIMCRENLKFWESKSREIFSVLSLSSSTVFDIGSYTGVYALVSAKSNKKLIVSAFEPNPDLFSALEKNLKLNRIRNVKSVQMALDDQPGEAYLYLNHDTHTSIGSLIQSSTAGKKVLVRKTSLDIYCEDYSISSIDLMKIDVEGYETNVIQGGLSIIKKSSPIILMESLTQETLEKQFKLLSALGYLRPLQVNGDGFDLNNWLWFTESNKSKVRKISHLLIN
jgi:FkbM family methyltransferase